jgi:hypothetical protein
MAARLGDVIYWLGCGIAIISIAAAVVLAIYGVKPDKHILIIIFSVGALVIWLIARACRYILAGR